jgi:predicted DNA-binding WGR domain protein
MNTPRLILLLKSGPGTGTSIAHKGGYALYGNPPRWRKITQDAPAPKGAPVAAHPKSAGHHEAAAHFTDDQWSALKLPDSNVNAPVFNKALEKLRAWSDAGDVTAIVGAGFGTNTYGAKLAKIANHLLGLHGSTHTVTPGQKPGTHAAAQVAEPADPHPTGLPEHLAPKEPEPAAITPASAETVATGTVFEFSSQYEKMNAGKWVVYNTSPDGQHVYMHKVGAKVPNQTNSATIPAATLAEAVAKGTAKKQAAPQAAAPAAPEAEIPASAPPASGALSAQQLQNLQSIPWFKLKLPPENTNAKSHNAAMAKIEAMAFAGDTAGLQAFINSKADAKQTYAKKQALTAQTALAGLGVDGATAAVPVEPAPVALQGKPAYDHLAHTLAAHKMSSPYDKVIAAKLAAQDWLAANPGGEPEMHDALASHDLSHHAAAIGMQTATPPAPAADPYPVVSEWKAAISAGKVPTKAQADAYEALTDHDPDAAMEYFMDAVNESMPAEKQTDEDYDDALEAAQQKAQELQGHALAGTKPQRASPAPAPAAPATPAQKLKIDAPLYENKEPGHSKFWSVSTLGSVMKTHYGKIGTKGQVTEKVFPSEQAAKNAAVKLMGEKKAKGYNYSGTAQHEYEAPAAVEPGPKEGDTKPGADGMLVFKNGHWVKQDDGMGGWTHSASNPGLDGSPSLEFEKDGKGYYLAGGGDDGFEFGVTDDSFAEPDTIPGETLAEILPQMKAMGYPIPPDAALKKLDPTYKPAAPAKVKKATLIDISTAIQTISPGQSKFSNNGAGKLATAAAKKGDGVGMANAYTKAHAMSFPKTASHIKAVAQAMGVDTSAWSDGTGPSPVTAAAPAAQVPPTAAGGMLPMDGWAQTGGQGGSNPGGKFKDPAGQEWYCKFPADADTAKSEVLAAKLYALAGLSSQDAVLVTKGGKVGIASKWVDIKKAATPGALAKVDGAQAGFAVDAWLGNWDVVGLGYDNLQVGPDGKAHRVDAGGSLEYRAQGEKKPFGSKVDELDTLLDAGKNPQAASVFKGMTKADLTASAAKVLAISDVAIRAMVNQYGPGDAAAKTKLAETLIARKADLAKRFPAAVKKKKAPVFKPEDISAPPSFLNWGGNGSSGPSSKEFLNKANEEAVQAVFAAAKTGDLDAIKGLTAPVYDKDSGQVVGHKPVLEHPSQHVKGYAQQAINEINYQLNPPKKFRFDGGHPLHSLNAAYPAFTGPASSAVAQKLGKFIVLGEPGSVNLADLGLPEKIKHAEGGGALSAQTYAKQAQAAIAKMPATQKQAVKSYTGSSYHAMNGSLWSGNPTGAAKAAGEALKTLGHDIAPGTVLSRKISLHGSDLDQLLKSSGKILQEPAIMSTSIRPSSWGGNVHLKLHVGPGVKGLWVGYHSIAGGGALSSNSGEDEMILPPGTRLMILSVKGKDGDADGFGKSSSHVIEAVILPTE